MSSLTKSKYLTLGKIKEETTEYGKEWDGKNVLWSLCGYWEYVRSDTNQTQDRLGVGEQTSPSSGKLKGRMGLWQGTRSEWSPHLGEVPHRGPESPALSMQGPLLLDLTVLHRLPITHTTRKQEKTQTHAILPQILRILTVGWFNTKIPKMI